MYMLPTTVETSKQIEASNGSQYLKLRVHKLKMETTVQMEQSINIPPKPQTLDILVWD